MSHISPPDYDRLNLGLRRPPTCLRTAPRACPTRSECRSPGWEGSFGCLSRCRRGTQKLGLRQDGHPYRPWQWQAKAEDNVNDEKGKKKQKLPCSTGPQWSHRCFWKLSSKAGQKEDFLRHFPRWQSWWHYHREGAELEMHPCDMCVVKSYQEWTRQLAGGFPILSHSCQILLHKWFIPLCTFYKITGRICLYFLFFVWLQIEQKSCKSISKNDFRK